jgi:hypothetical protein
VSPVKPISSNVLLSSGLLSTEDYTCLSIELEECWLTPSQIISIDLPARNRVEALLRKEFFGECQLRELSCDFAEHTLHIFERYCPDDPRPRKVVEIARLYYSGSIGEGRLKDAFVEAWRAIERFKDNVYKAAFASGIAASLLYSGEAEKMARDVAVWAQNAAHRREWEGRKSNFQPMFGREKEAAWQLKHIATKITK